MDCRRNEHGAILIIVAVSLIALMAFSALIVDYGVMWVARGQAQNSADAGALAGAIARLHDDLDNPPIQGGVAYNEAVALAKQNFIWGEAPTAFQVSWDRPTGLILAIQGKFARVDVFRNGQFGSHKLPVFFLPLVGISSQGVRATATAVAAFANVTSSCLKPWMIPDRWVDTNGNGVYDSGEYTPPDPVTGLGGTGYHVPQDIGAKVTFKPARPADAISPSDFYELDLNGSGGADYGNFISGCSNYSAHVGSVLTVEPGSDVGNTKSGLRDLIDSDPHADWDGTKVINSNGNRIVPIALFSPQVWFNQDRKHGKFTEVVVNILGFFVYGFDNSSGDVTGYLVSIPGKLDLTMPSPAPGDDFLQQVVLVR
jgi:hypothetical protein